MTQGNKLTLITASVGLLLIAALAAWQLRPVHVEDALGEPVITFGSPDAPHRLVASSHLPVPTAPDSSSRPAMNSMNEQRKGNSSTPSTH